MAMVLQIWKQGGPPDQEWNTGYLATNAPCEYPTGNRKNFSNYLNDKKI